MAVRTCPICLSEVREGEKNCPRCGHLMVGEPRDHSDNVQVYVDDRRWSVGNTLVAALLVLLILGLGVFLFLNGLKWPYEDAKRYYREEKAAYEEQIAEYQELNAQIAEGSERLERRTAEVRALVNSGEEPLEARPLTNAREAVRVAEQALATQRQIEMPDTVPVPVKDSIFHAKDIRETAKSIDQMRFSLYQQATDLRIPDYTQLIATLDRTETELRNSIREKKEADIRAREQAAALAAAQADQEVRGRTETEAAEAEAVQPEQQPAQTDQLAQTDQSDLEEIP